MRLPVFYPGKWNTCSARILKYERYKDTPICFASFRYSKYHSYTEFKEFINELCKDHPIEKFYETLWFFIKQISVYIKNNKCLSLLWLYNYSMIYYFIKHHDSGMSLFMYLSMLLLATMSVIFAEMWNYFRTEAHSISDAINKKLRLNVASKDE